MLENNIQQIYSLKPVSFADGFFYVNEHLEKGGNIQTGKIASALSGLPGGKNFDIGSLISKIQGNTGLASMVTSSVDRT